MPHSEDYKHSWNNIVKVLTHTTYTLDRDIILESFRYAAHLGLLEHVNEDKCRAVLDATDAYAKSGVIPKSF